MSETVAVLSPSESTGKPGPTEVSLGQRAVRGSLWTMVGFGGSQVLRLISNIVLAAVLYQEAFALMALVNAVIQGLVMFSDIGIGPSVIQNPRGDDRDFLDTAWTIQVIRGTVLSLLAVALAYPVAAFYAENDPSAWELRWLIPIVAVGTFLEGFQSTKVKTAARHMNLGRVTVLDFICQIAGIAVMLGVAVVTRSVYALAVGSVVSMTLHVLLSHVMLEGPTNRFRWDPTAVRDLVRFGRWVMISTMIFFLALQLDKFVLAKLFPLDQVGVYAIAANLAMLTPLLMGRFQSAVAFPLFARVLDRSESLEAAVKRAKAPMLAVGGYLVALMIGGAETFVRFAYDERYYAAGAYIGLLSLGSWFAVLDGIYGAALLARGRAQWMAYVGATKLVAFAVLIAPAMSFAGIFGAVSAVAASEFVKLGVGLWGARTIGLNDRRPDVLYTVFTVVVGCGAMFLARAVRDGLGLAPFLTLVILFVAISGVFAPTLLPLARELRARRS